MSGKKSEHPADESSEDPHLRGALVKAYAARAKLFHGGVANSDMRKLFDVIDAFPAGQLKWDCKSLGMSQQAFEAVAARAIQPHQLFAHPDVLVANPRAITYYRNLVAVSQKGMSQIGFPTTRFERNSNAKMTAEQALGFAQVLNNIISRVIETTPAFALSNSRDVAFAELGTELQGTWANVIGKGAARTVEDIIVKEMQRRSLVKECGKGRYVLVNGWTVVFGSEPDISFTDAHGMIKIAVEIKGSLDKAGAQTRYGETKKSFAKAIALNPRCHTIYLGSCFTSSVMRQIQADGQVRETFNLTAIIYDPKEQERFLQKLFYVINTPT